MEAPKSEQIHPESVTRWDTCNSVTNKSQENKSYIFQLFLLLQMSVQFQNNYCIICQQTSISQKTSWVHLYAFFSNASVDWMLICCALLSCHWGTTRRSCHSHSRHHEKISILWTCSHLLSFWWMHSRDHLWHAVKRGAGGMSILYSRISTSTKKSTIKHVKNPVRIYCGSIYLFQIFIERETEMFFVSGIVHLQYDY